VVSGAQATLTAGRALLEIKRGPNEWEWGPKFETEERRHTTLTATAPFSPSRCGQRSVIRVYLVCGCIVPNRRHFQELTTKQIRNKKTQFAVIELRTPALGFLFSIDGELFMRRSSETGAMSASGVRRTLVGLVAMSACDPSGHVRQNLVVVRAN